MIFSELPRQLNKAINISKTGCRRLHFIHIHTSKFYWVFKIKNSNYDTKNTKAKKVNIINVNKHIDTTIKPIFANRRVGIELYVSHWHSYSEFFFDWVGFSVNKEEGECLLLSSSESRGRTYVLLGNCILKSTVWIRDKKN